MKKLLLLIIVLACMGCDGEACSELGPDGSITQCQQPEGQSCGFLKQWDTCTCRCEWWGGF